MNTITTTNNQSNYLTMPGANLFKTGLTIDENASKEDFENIASRLIFASDSVLFWLGDLLNIAEQRYGECFAKMIALTGYAYQTLADAKWVCSKLEFSLRIENLSYTHHKTALSECDGVAKEASEWLKEAEENKWSISQMRVHIRKSKGEYQESDEQKSNSTVAATRGLYEIKRALLKLEALPKESHDFWSHELIDIVQFWLKITPINDVERLFQSSNH